jgi:YesN/AraC family two-component response regulator
MLRGRTDHVIGGASAIMARILIVDDSMIMRRNLKTILTEAGHTIVGEANATHMPDLVTMDINMPVMNGIESVKRIIEIFPDARIVMISALEQRHMVFEALKSGAKHYIVKPIVEDKVIEVITQVLTA